MTITIRADRALKKALERRARESGSTMSDVAREILKEALVERPLGERVGHLRGSITVQDADPGWRAALRERNWRE